MPECPFECCFGAIGCRQFRVDDRIDREFIGFDYSQQLRLRPVGPLGVVGQHVDEHVGVDEDHLGLVFTASQAHQLIGGFNCGRPAALAEGRF